MPTIKSLFKNIPIVAASRKIEGRVEGIQYDSRLVNVGDLFVAIDGLKTDGHLYIAEALGKQAFAVVIDNPDYCSPAYFWILVADSRKALALLSINFFDHPTEDLLLIGVTGTNGKTTTTNLIADIFEAHNYKVGLIGTIENRIGDYILQVERTTPESLDLQILFSQMRWEKVNCAILEVSSHALDLERVYGCDFDLAVFTNLSQDHLDFHHDMESYYQSKAKLFLDYLNDQHKCAIINVDDTWGQRLFKRIKGPKLSYGIAVQSDIQAQKIQVTATGVKFFVHGFPVQLHLTGRFNIYNALAAMGVALYRGLPLEQVIMALKEIVGVPGRLQIIPGPQKFTVIVDYAHTPDGLKNILSTAREFAENRIITVFGCGGDRDRSKRPLMREAAGFYSDLCIITSDNPRTEDPGSIIADIMQGIKAQEAENKFMIIEDRKSAIKKAISLAQNNDIIIIAGKGHETYQEINGLKYPFDDRKIAEEILHEIGY